MTGLTTNLVLIPNSFIVLPPGLIAVFVANHVTGLPVHWKVYEKYWHITRDVFNMYNEII